MNNAELTKEIESLKTQVSTLQTELNNLKVSTLIPVEFDKSFRDRFKIDFKLQGTGIGTVGATTVINAFPFNLPANPSTTIKVLYNGTIYELLAK